MQTVEISIRLDPTSDGINWIPKKIKMEGKHALVIGTNGKFRIVEEDEAASILDKLSGNCISEYMGHTEFLLVCTAKKIIKTGEARFIAGSVLIVKAGRNGIDLLTDEEIDAAKTEFAARLVTLCADGMEFSAYEMD